MAETIAELARDTLRRFRAIDPRAGRVLLIEAADRVLTGFPPSLSRKAARSLEELGVTPMLDRKVVAIDRESVAVETPGGARRIPAHGHLGGRCLGVAAGDAPRRGRARARSRGGGSRSSPT